MEEEKAAAYYEELTRKGQGAARFKQGLGFSSTSNNSGNSNDAFPTRGSSSSFLSSFVRASNTTDFDKQAQLQTIQSKLKKKPKVDKDYENSLSSRVSKGKTRSPSREKHSSRRSPSPSRNSKRHSRQSPSRNRDAYRPYRSRCRSGSRDGDKHSERDREKEKQGRRRSRSVSPRSDKVGNDRTATLDYSKLIQSYEKMTPAERVKAKMKLQLSESAVEDDGALVNHIGKSFRLSAVETRREEQIRAAHDEAIFGAPSLVPLPPSTETDVVEEVYSKKDISKISPATCLISGQALAMQGGSWRDRVRRS
ncbi:unnamed protein product [Withania somnifera]